MTPAPPRIRRQAGAFCVEGCPEARGAMPSDGWASVFEVFASEEPAAPAMLGGYAIDGEALVFTPRYTPAPALRLRAVYRPAGGAPPVTAWFGGVPEPPRAPTTRVLSVTPSADVWPENILRLYVTFSAPMRIGVAWDHIRLWNARGERMGGLFVEIEQELWDPEGRRLTVLFDPARIKRGLVDHINEGPPLVQGEDCTLEIDAFWRDAGGALLAAPVRRTIRVEPPLRAPIDLAEWRLTPPASAADALVVDFPRPLDAALAPRALSVRKGRLRVACDSELQREETRLVLTPQRPWIAGQYVLHAASILEDVAGNRIGRPFDIDRSDPRQRDAAAVEGRRAFEVEFGRGG